MGRIIAGKAKGMRVEAPRGQLTRPTADRVKEALFSAVTSWFGVVDQPTDSELEGLAVLDLFSGSGALGLEAASRGASRVLCVDSRTAGTIRANARHTGLRVDVAPGRVKTIVADLPRDPFDLVFIDPPYDLPTPEVEALVGQLELQGLLSDEALVVIERTSRTTPPTWPGSFPRNWSRGYGETTLHYGAFEQEESS